MQKKSSMMNRWNYSWAATFVVIALITSGCGIRHESLTVRTYIDGTDVIKISGNKLWFEHETFNLPGTEGGINNPTEVNGIEWTPQWNENVSVPYEGVTPAFVPKDIKRIQVSKRTGRGDVTIVQMPTPENNHTIGIKIDDNEQSGADMYDILVSW